MLRPFEAQLAQATGMRDRSFALVAHLRKDLAILEVLRVMKAAQLAAAGVEAKKLA